MPRLAPPPKQKTATRRSRDYLTPDEVEQLSQAARRLGRHGHRDATMILLAFRHGLRVSELVALQWEQVNLKEGTLSPPAAEAWLEHHVSLVGASDASAQANAAGRP